MKLIKTENIKKFRHELQSKVIHQTASYLKQKNVTTQTLSTVNNFLHEVFICNFKSAF